VTRQTLAALAIGLAAGCRTSVQLELPRDAATSSRDAGVDARVLDARVIDAARVDAATDAPDLDAPLPPVCEGPGVILGSVAATDPQRAPSIALVGSGSARRGAVLVPPGARVPVASVAQLLVIDREGVVLLERDVPVGADGGVLVLARPDASTTSGEAAFELVLGDRLQAIDSEGANVGAPRMLPVPMGTAHASRAGLVASDRLVYVAGDGALVSVELVTGAGTPSAARLESDADLLYVSEGSIVLNRAAPAFDVSELSPGLDGETLHLTQAQTNYAGRVIGALRAAGERRWVAHGDGEFRASTDVLRVGADGSLVPLVSERLVGPFQPAQRDGLVVIETSSGSIVAIDPAEATIRTLLDAGLRDLAAAARHDGDVALLTMEAGDPDARLVFRCLR
jgi:hypothetical protein